ncbi:hypothetical protein CN905_15770 [Bacillus wiedmannii]|nr:hypothetical protein CN905_15770 [Bacillus wiedmannii]
MSLQLNIMVNSRIQINLQSIRGVFFCFKLNGDMKDNKFNKYKKVMDSIIKQVKECVFSNLNV